MNFLKLEEDIIDFIRNNFNEHLIDLPQLSEDDFVFDFLDFDKYKRSNVFFFDFPEFYFQSLSNMDNQENITMHVYVKCTNGTSKELKKRCTAYTSAFYNFFEESPCNRSFCGLIDYGIINSVTFYDAAEGNINIKVADIQLQLTLED